MKCNYNILPLFIAGIMSFTACAAAAQNEETLFEWTATPVPTPLVPSQVTFCGQNVSLDREDMYERYDRELTGLVYGHGNTLLMLKRANKYFPVIAPILKANGVPEDVLYLACVESTLDNRAYSPAKAAGIWQFIESTAKQYGLEVNDEVDERYNLEKATEAACKFLKSAYAKYGNWPTVMASYNAGMARISKELDSQMQKSSFDLYLNPETSRYVFRIMALAQIFNDPARYGFRLYPEQFYFPAESEIVTVDTTVESWPEWAEKHGISFAQLKEENPWIRDKKLTNKNGKTYKVKVPVKKSLSRSNIEPKLFNRKWAQ